MSCEAEYIVGSTATYQCVWLARLLSELRNEQLRPFILKMDSQSAIALSKNLVFHERSKHIDVRFHFIRECIGDGKMDLDQVRTEEQLADILTKPLGSSPWEETSSVSFVLCWGSARLSRNIKFRG